jgi:DNA repair photolyase
MVVTFKEYECKSMLRMHKYVDNWFWSSATVSPYKACEHACNYCDGRSQKYHASEDFDQIVHVKINAPDVLRKELNRLFPGQKTLSDFREGEKKYRKLKPVIAVSSGISDAYQPIEKKYGLTRKLLEILKDFSMPTYVMTKSDVVLRDLDLLSEINERAWCNVSFSVSTLDKKISKIFEPRATPPKKRLEAMRTIASEGILAGVTYIPIIPYITDSNEQLEKTISNSKESDAGYILAGTMTMRDQQAKRFYEILNMHYPELVEKYKTLYSGGYDPQGKYWRELFPKIKALCNKYDILNYIPRHIPDVEMKKNLETSTMLFLIAYFLSLEGERYKAESYRRLGQAIEKMDSNIEELSRDKKLNEIKGIGTKTAKLIEEFLETGKCGYLEELKG